VREPLTDQYRSESAWRSRVVEVGERLPVHFTELEIGQDALALVLPNGVRRLSLGIRNALTEERAAEKHVEAILEVPRIVVRGVREGGGNCAVTLGLRDDRERYLLHSLVGAVLVTDCQRSDVFRGQSAFTAARAGRCGSTSTWAIRRGILVLYRACVQ